MGRMIIDKAQIGNFDVDKIYKGSEELYSKITITMYPKNEAPNGVYVMTEDDYCLPGTDFLYTDKIASGIALVTDGYKALMSLDIASNKKWGAYEVNIQGLNDTTDQEIARLLINGKDNTRFIINSGITDVEAAIYCNSYSKGKRGRGSWWLPAAGEILLLKNYWRDYRTIVSGVFNQTFRDGPYWTSVEYNSKQVYVAFVGYDSFIQPASKFQTDGGSSYPLLVMPFSDF